MGLLSYNIGKVNEKHYIKYIRLQNGLTTSTHNYPNSQLKIVDKAIGLISYNIGKEKGKYSLLNTLINLHNEGHPSRESRSSPSQNGSSRREFGPSRRPTLNV